MKRLCACLLTFLFPALALIGCSKAPEKSAPVTAGFSCRMDASFGDMTVSATLSKPDADSLSLKFEKPAALSGIVLARSEEGLAMTLAGMRIQLTADKVPQGALLESLFEALSGPLSAGKQTDEGYTVTGEADGKAYTVVFDPATGMPRRLSVPADSLEAVFSEAVSLSAE